MLAVVLALIQQEEVADRTPAIYRCPASEVIANPHRFESLVRNYGFDTYCIEPAPPAAAKELLKKYKLKTIAAKEIDTAPNLAWRNVTIDFVNGKISPKAWLDKTSKIKATIHFLSSPKTRELREATGEVSHYATFAEVFLLAWHGRPCLTNVDIWKTRELPDAGKLQNWVLAMNDWLGPMLYYRHESPFLVTQKPKIISAPSTPGLFIFSTTDGKKTITMYFNNGDKPVKMPKIDFDNTTITRGLNIEEDDSITLREKGSAFVEVTN